MGNSFTSKQTPTNPQLNLLSQAQANLIALFEAQKNVAEAGGVVSVTIDGNQTVFQSGDQLRRAIADWENRVAILSGRRRRAVSIDLTGF